MQKSIWSFQFTGQRLQHNRCGIPIPQTWHGEVYNLLTQVLITTLTHGIWYIYCQEPRFAYFPRAYTILLIYISGVNFLLIPRSAKLYHNHTLYPFHNFAMKIRWLISCQTRWTHLHVHHSYQLYIHSTHSACGILPRRDQAVSDGKSTQTVH